MWPLWGFLTGARWRKRPDQGLLGAGVWAFDASAKLVLAVVTVICVGVISAAAWTEHQDKAHNARIWNCLQAQPRVPVPVTYPSGPTEMITDSARERCVMMP